MSFVPRRLDSARLRVVHPGPRGVRLDCPVSVSPPDGPRRTPARSTARIRRAGARRSAPPPLLAVAIFGRLTSLATRARAIALVGFALLFAGLWPSAALAGPEINIPRAEDGPGIKAGQRSTFHPGFALVTGLDSNVFSTDANEVRDDDSGPAASSFVMPVGWLGIGNRAFRDGLLMSPPERSGRVVDYYLGAIAGFRQYIAPRNRNVLGQSRVSGGLQLRAAFLPGRRFSINFDEDFFRYAQPSNFEAQPQFNFNRIDHKGQLTFIGRPGGGRFSILVGLRNQALIFENRAGSSDLPKGNRTVNGFQTELKWRFLPKSSIVFNYGMDWTFYLACCENASEGRNEDNFAHRITAGYRGQVLKKVTLDALAGYGMAFYRDDPNGPDFNSFIGELSFSYFPNPRAIVHFGAFRNFQDSLFGNYYVDAGARFQFRWEFKWRMIGTAGAWVAGRRYFGLPVPGVESPTITSYQGRGSELFQRRDTVFNFNLKVEQPLRKIFSVAVQYDVAVDSTDFVTFFENGGVDQAGFVRHILMGLGAVRF